MAVAKLLFYLVAYLLIRLGALVGLVLSLPSLIIKSSFSLLKKTYSHVQTYSRKISLPEFNLKFKKPEFPKFSFKSLKKTSKKYEYLKPKPKKTNLKKQVNLGISSKLKYFLFGCIFSTLFIFIPLIFYIFV